MNTRILAAHLFPFYQLIPKGLRKNYSKNHVQLNANLPTQLEFKIAETMEELEWAYRLLHDSQITSRQQNPDSTKIKTIKHFALPTTTLFVAKWDGVVMGMASIVRKGPFGLPMESAFDLSGMESAGQSFAEISHVVISERFQHRLNEIFFPFFGFLYSYMKNHMTLDKLFVAVPPQMVNLYESLDFLFLEKPLVKKYSLENKLPVIGMWSDMKTWESRLKELYEKESVDCNLYQYLMHQSLKNSKFSEHPFANGMGPIMTPTMLNFFFRIKSSVFEELTEKEVLALYSCYPQKSYALVLPKLSESDFRRSTRFIVHAEGTLNNGKPIRVMEVSDTGIRLQGPLPRRTNFEFRVKVSAHQESKLQGLIHWIDQEKNFYGVQILNSDSVWKEYLTNLKAEFEKRKTQMSPIESPASVAPAVSKTASQPKRKAG